MVNIEVLSREIDRMKNVLECTARRHKYNFKHPKVIEVSQRLDRLILKLMKQRA